MAAILSCPVCGKTPKIKHRDSLYGHVVKISCGPFFGKLHEEALAYGAYSYIAYNDAINLWNARVKNYKEVTRNANANH